MLCSEKNPILINFSFNIYMQRSIPEVMLVKDLSFSSWQPLGCQGQI